jgi:hypothetical protein
MPNRPDVASAGFWMDARDAGYESKGMLNALGKQETEALMNTWENCLTQRHDTTTASTRMGSHRRACHDCRYIWGYDSGD